MRAVSPVKNRTEYLRNGSLEHCGYSVLIDLVSRPEVKLETEDVSKVVRRLRAPN